MGVSFHHPKATAATAAPAAPGFPMEPKPNIEHRAYPYPSLLPATSQPWDVPKLELVPHSGTCPGIAAGERARHIKLSKNYEEGGFGLGLAGAVFSPSQAVIRVMKGSSPLCCHPYSNQQPLPVKQVTHQTRLH